MLKPLLPMVDDWYAHEFNPIQHEIKVHMVYGNHHLDKDLADRNAEEDHNKDHNSVKGADQVPSHVLAEGYKNCTTPVLISKKLRVSGYLKLTPVFISRDSPPPKLT
jgi:hypothetical protein